MYLSICLSICLSIYLPVYLSIDVSTCTLHLQALGIIGRYGLTGVSLGGWLCLEDPQLCSLCL